MMSSAAVANNRVFVGLEHGKAVIALQQDSPDHNGTLIWNYNSGSVIRSSPAVAGDTVFIGDEGGNRLLALEAFANEGERLKWKYDVDGPIFSSPAASDGMIFVATSSGTIYAFY
ncbi:MAG: outer membrane protein assembly factor BamB family protein, partial [Planctomycetota bacterium]|jgi:outer membrane protein assembly factor BamB